MFEVCCCEYVLGLDVETFGTHNILLCAIFRQWRRRERWRRQSLLLSPPANHLTCPPQIAGAAEEESREEFSQRNSLSSNSARRSMENTTPPSCTAGLPSPTSVEVPEMDICWRARFLTKDQTPSSPLIRPSCFRFPGSTVLVVGLPVWM